MGEISLGVEGSACNMCNMYIYVHLAIGVLRSFGALQAVVSWSVHVLHVSKQTNRDPAKPLKTT